MALSVLLILTACDPMSPPLVRHEGGYRLVEEMELELWMGDECDGITALEVVLSKEDEDLDLARFESTENEGASISHWILGSVPEGFQVVDPLEADWDLADTIRFRVEADESRTSSHLVVNSFSEDASQQDNSWYVQDEGWLTDSEYNGLVADENGVLPLCPNTG